MTFSDLSILIGCPKNVLRYVIYSTSTFGSMFRIISGNKVKIEAIPLDEIYIGKVFY